MSVLRNEPFATENIFHETCLFSVCLVAYDPYSTPGLSKTESTQSVFTNKLEI